MEGDGLPEEREAAVDEGDGLPEEREAAVEEGDCLPEEREVAVEEGDGLAEGEAGVEEWEALEKAPGAFLVKEAGCLERLPEEKRPSMLEKV